MKMQRFRMAAHSRDPRFLTRAVLYILGAGIVAALLASILSPVKAELITDDSGEVVPKTRVNDRWIPEIQSRSESWKVFPVYRLLRPGSGVRLAEMEKAVSQSPSGGTKYFSTAELALFGHYEKCMRDPAALTPDRLKVITALTAEASGSGLAGSMHGDLLRIAGEYDQALQAYEKGAADQETGADARRRALELCLQRDWPDKLRGLYTRPGWREAALDFEWWTSWSVAERIIMTAGDWSGIFLISVQDAVSIFQYPLWVVMASLTALLWFAVIHVGGDVPLRRWWLGLAGFGCGMLSIPVTLFFGALQADWFGVNLTDAALTDLAYCISGVGLIEELAKLLLFVPFLFLLKRNTPVAQVLAIASSVGLGFAASENVQYFEGFSYPAIWSRYMTANFLHFALTGLAGTALWLAVSNPSKWLQHFTMVFVGAVLFHGLWNWSTGDARFDGDLGILRFVGLVMLSMWYFRDLLSFTQPRPGVPSAVSVYILGGAVVVSVILTVAAWEIGFRFALASTFQSVIGSFIIGAAMFYQLRRA